MSARLCALFCCCVFGAMLGAGPITLSTLPTVMIPPALSAPVLDGKLDDACWSLAAEVGPFVAIDGSAAGSRATTRLCYANRTLFLAFTCKTEKGSDLDVREMARDGDVFTQECVEVFIDPGLSMRRYRHLLLSAGNVQRDETGDRLASPRFEVSWNAQWTTAVRIGDDAWRAEIAIPFDEVGLAPEPGTLFGLNLCRHDTTGGLSCWSPTVSGFHVPHRFGLAMLAPPGRVAEPLRIELPASLTATSLTATATGKGETLRLLMAGEKSTHRKVRTVPMSHGLAKWTMAELEPGLTALVASALDAQGKTVGMARLVMSTPLHLTRQVGSALPGPGALGLWWAGSMHKIHRWTERPQTMSQAIRIHAAGGEAEAVQLVLRPDQDVPVSIQVEDLKRGFGPRIEASAITCLQVGYVPVSKPTDRFGWADDWPDPLLPMREPVSCKRGQNQPFWILVTVPRGQRAGLYRGDIVVTADGKPVKIPLDLEVFDFSLTKETHTRTAYGVSPPYGYLGLKTAEQKREVYDLYMQSCRDHRIAPYSPMAHYPIRTSVRAPSRTYTSGKFGIQFMLARQEPWQMMWDGNPIATQRTSMTHFEKEGVGWKGKGVSWPYVDAVESVECIEETPTIQHLRVAAVHSASAPASRRYRLLFDAYVPVRGNWLAWRLAKMESLDPVPVTIRGYFNLPRTTFAAETVVNGDSLAGWTDGRLGFGMLCLGAPTSGLQAESGRPALTVYNKPPEEFRIQEGESHDGWGPLVVYFAGDDLGSEDRIRGRADALRKRIDVENPLRSQVPGAEEAPWQVEVTEDYAFQHDFSEFDKGARRYLDEFGFNGFNFRGLPGTVAGHRRFSDEYRRYHAMRQRPIIEHLRKRGWLSKAYSYWYDEPGEEDYPYVIDGMQTLGWNCPGLTRLLTEQPEPELADHVDLWVPVLAAFRPEDCRDRQFAGDRVWWYVCCGPRAPYPNNFIDHPGINHRIRFWMAEKYGVTGSLYWSTTYMGKNENGQPRHPYSTPMSYSSRGTTWGNGDGFLLYPASKEPSDTPILAPPVVSMRWELLRDGIEDREYFWLLNREVARLEAMLEEKGDHREVKEALKIAREALKSPGRLAESLTVYSKDPDDLLAERRQLAEAIITCRNVR